MGIIHWRWTLAWTAGDLFVFSFIDLPSPARYEVFLFSVKPSLPRWTFTTNSGNSQHEVKWVSSESVCSGSKCSAYHRRRYPRPDIVPNSRQSVHHVPWVSSFIAYALSIMLGANTTLPTNNVQAPQHLYFLMATHDTRMTEGNSSSQHALTSQQRVHIHPHQRLSTILIFFGLRSSDFKPSKK